MKPWLDDGDLRLYHGDVLTVLRGLPSGIAQTCVTSPPYWGLRDYGTGTWSGGDERCDHQPKARGNPDRERALTGRGVLALPQDIAHKDVCGKCGAQRVDDQLGLEATPDQYVAKMVAVFREVRRVLRPDGTLWLNIGDSYAGSGKGGNPEGSEWSGFVGNNGREKAAKAAPPIIPAGLKSKDLVGIPWRLALALQADGWYLRSDIIWAKPNPMPESVTDRPTKAHEYVFLFSKQPRYFYDADAVRETITSESSIARNRSTPRQVNGKMAQANPDVVMRKDLGRTYSPVTEAGRNLRSVWQIATQPFPEAHFATYPEELVRRCILAGTSERGGCAECGAPWRRVTETKRRYIISEGGSHAAGTYRVRYADGEHSTSFTPRGGDSLSYNEQRWHNETTTTGWEPSCSCDSKDPVTPQLVLDPFVGSGTTALVARKHGRHTIGIDLSAEYLAIAARRTRQLSLLGGTT